MVSVYLEVVDEFGNCFSFFALFNLYHFNAGWALDFIYFIKSEPWIQIATELLDLID